LIDEKNELHKNLENEKMKNMNKEINNGNKNFDNEMFNNLNSRILEIQKINIQIDKELKEKENQINILEKERDFLSKKLSESRELNEKNNNYINEKNKKIIADDFALKDLTRKLKATEEDLKNVEDENLVYKNKIEGLQKNLNFLLENQNESSKNSKDSQEKLITKLEAEIEYLNIENNKLKDELENARNQCERLIDEINENHILKMDPSANKRADEINVTLYNNNNTNLNNSSHLNNSNSIFDLNNTKDNNNNNINVLMNSIGNNNYMTINTNKIGKEKEIENEYMLKIIDYEDKLEKLIFSNSELQRKNNSLNIEIKTLQEKIYALEHFQEPEINKKFKQLKLQENSGNANIPKDFKTIQIENERLQELNKDYEMSISQLQNKLEMQYNEIMKLREEYEEEIINIKKKEGIENFSFFGNEKTERNNLTFFDSNENDLKASNFKSNNEELLRKLNFEINEKNKLIEKLTKELNDSYALMGEANKKLEIFELDFFNKSINNK